jgi:hypothetical protein
MTTLAILASIFSICLFVGSLFLVDVLYDKGRISQAMGWAILTLATIVCVMLPMLVAG